MTTRRWVPSVCLGFVAACAVVAPSKAQEVKSISIVTPFVRAMPPAARVGGGYMVIRNDSGVADRLLAARSPGAKGVEIHSSTMEGGISRMRHLMEGVPVPPNSDTALVPGGLHLMFIEPDAPFTVGQTIPVTLVFERAGAIEVSFEVRTGGR